MQSRWIGKEIAAYGWDMLRIAIYDMDKTITRRPTWTPFLLSSAWHFARWRLIFVPVLALLVVGYAARLVSRAGLKEAAQYLMIGRATDARRVRAMADRFADRLTASGLFPQALAQMADDRAAGCRLVLATASFDFYVRAIAERLGVDDVIATGSASSPSGQVLAKIAGENCYGPAKLAMIRDWMAHTHIDRDATHIRFYSDHVSDSPTLAWADEAVAVNPHPPLRALALAKGWAIRDWTS